jgi:PEGA domain
MLALIRTLIVGASVLWAGIATARPRAETPYEAAVRLISSGDPDGALKVLTEGLPATPKDLRMLALKASVLITLRDYAGALQTYQEYVAAGAKGAGLRQALKQIERLKVALATSLEVTATNGAVTVYLDTKTKGVFCTAAPTCKKEEFPGDYKVIVERPGFERWTGRVTLEAGKTVKVTVTMVDQPSPLTVRVAQAEAIVTVDGAPYDASAKLRGGSHRVVVKLPGHKDEQFEVMALEGKPIEIDVSLTPLVPAELSPATATLVLDGKPVVLVDGALPVPSGSRVLVARAAGFKDLRIEIPAQLPAGYKLPVTLEALAAKLRTAPPRGLWTLRRKIAAASAGVAVAAFTGGVFLGLSSSRLEDDALTLCPIPTNCPTPKDATDLNQRAQTRAFQANVAYGLAGVAAVGAAVLWFTGAPRESQARRVTVTPRLGTVAGLDLNVTF